MPAIGQDYLFLTVLVVVLFLAASYGYLHAIEFFVRRSQHMLIDLAHRHDSRTAAALPLAVVNPQLVPVGTS